MITYIQMGYLKISASILQNNIHMIKHTHITWWFQSDVRFGISFENVEINIILTCVSHSCTLKTFLLKNIETILKTFPKTFIFIMYWKNQWKFLIFSKYTDPGIKQKNTQLESKIHSFPQMVIRGKSLSLKYLNNPQTFDMEKRTEI